MDSAAPSPPRRHQGLFRHSVAHFLAATRQLEDAVAQSLEGLANWTPGGEARPAPDLDAALAAVERAFTLARDAVPTDAAVVAIERRLELYRTLVRLVSQLALPVRAPVGALRGSATG